MDIIKQNPFRVLGLTGNATERELQKQLGKIKAFERVGKEINLDYDFIFLGNLSRNLEDIQQSSNCIEQAHNKLLYSLFWFVKNSPFDEIAFNNLKGNQIEKAIEIWNKTLKSEITTKNYTSYQNLSTLYIALSTIDDQIELQKLQAGISLKGNLINSECLKDFSKLVTGNGNANDPIEISKKFIDEVVELLKPYLNKSNGISTNDLISLFNTFPESSQKYISNKFTEIPISKIENKIDKTLRKREDNPEDAEKYGEELYKSTKSDIALLKKLMGASNVQFQMIANKLANELLECSIVFYNHWSKNAVNDFDPFDDALKIAKYAKSIGSTGQARNRIDEAITTLEDIRFKNAFQLIAFLKEIIGVFAEVEKKNFDIQAIISGRRTSVNEGEVMKMIKPIFTDQLVKKISNSKKNNLINDFNQTLNKVINLFSYTYSNFFKKKKDIFISELPISNNIKYNYVKAKIDREIRNLNSELSDVKSKQYYSSKLQNLNYQMINIKEWQLFRGRETRESQISDKQQEINRIIEKAENEKKRDISRIEEQLVIKRREYNELTNQ